MAALGPRAGATRTVSRQPSKRYLFRHRHRPQIRLERLETLWIFLLGVLIGHRSGNDNVLARPPVHWRCDRVLGGQLKGIKQTQYFIEVAARGHRIDEHRLYFLVRSDDE